jgi:hypothetical protein
MFLNWANTTMEHQNVSRAVLPLRSGTPDLSTGSCFRPASYALSASISSACPFHASYAK